MRVNKIVSENFNAIENDAHRADRLGYEPASTSQCWKIAFELERTAKEPGDFELGGGYQQSVLTKTRASHIIKELAEIDDALKEEREKIEKEFEDWNKKELERASVKREMKKENTKAFVGLKKGARIQFEKLGKKHEGLFDGKRSKGRIRIIYKEERTAEELNRLAGIDEIHYEAAVKKYGKIFESKTYIDHSTPHTIITKG